MLGSFRYSVNRTVLHTDRAYLPRRPAAHASWNYVADPDTAQVAVTYSMTRLQGLPDTPYLVTLNPRSRPANVLHEVSFRHPQLDRAALAAQAELPRLAGRHRTYYAGSLLRVRLSRGRHARQGWPPRPPRSPTSNATTQRAPPPSAG